MIFIAATQKNTETTRQLIIDSAIEMFQKKGYSKTTLEDIVRNIGMTRGAFYWNFKDKSDILALLEEQYKEYYLDLYRFEALTSAFDTLRNMLLRNIKAKLDAPNGIAFLMRYQLEVNTELPELIDMQRDLDQQLIQKIAGQISRGIDQGEFDPSIDVDQTAFFLFTALLGVSDYLILHYTDDYKEELLEHINIYHYVDQLLLSLH